MNGQEKLLLVGNASEEHIGSHLRHAAAELGIPAEFADTREASGRSRIVRAIYWRAFGRRPPALASFSRKIVEQCRRAQPKWMLTTGFAPVDRQALDEAGALGIYRVNYLTDDPWNRVQYAPWFLRALPAYDEVFTTRRANVEELRSLGCRRVEYLPFAYTPQVHFPATLTLERRRQLESDVVFAGGGDADRVPYMAALARAGIRLALYGGYWNRFPETRAITLGPQPISLVREAFAAAKVALCLVRRANRDGQCMRTFEAPAMGACMLVEKTAEHLELFGPEGAAVVYFESLDEMVEKARCLLQNEEERERLKQAAHRLIVEGPHRYRDRLAAMLQPAGSAVKIVQP